MQPRSPEEDQEASSARARERWETEGGHAGSEAVAALGSDHARALAPEPLPFPPLEAKNMAPKDLELVPLVHSTTFGKYRVQQAGLGERGPVFLVRLFGATCAKVQMRIGRQLVWRDYLRAMKVAIERELGYWQKRGEPFPLDVPREIDITIRDTDFAIS